MPQTTFTPDDTTMDGPVLLFGSPRSGTTWLGKIFDSHPHTLYRHEPDSWGRLNWMPIAPEVEDTERYAGRLRDFVAHLPHSRETKVAGTLPLFHKDYYNSIQELLNRASVTAAKLAARTVGEVRVPSVAARAERNARLVWKSIESVGRLGVAARAIPESRAIHIVRHPCGYVGSVVRGEQQHRFTGDGAAAEDYGLIAAISGTEPARRYGIDVQVAHDLHPAERMAWSWVIFNEKAIEDTKGLTNVRLLIYETLCHRPTEVARELFQHCGLPWSSQTEAFLGASTSRENKAYYSVFKNPEAAAQRWRKELAPEIQQRVMDVVAKSRLAEHFPE